ncbi:ankyrin repeat-containing domain protein [Dactylonectria estremocensis]|uniref:Ankyrin repeat-containing domain protein n=1 Tax=Dactylonectria estremocensis TaxID=1079267 RepID=A0A9P9EKX4_9HYPO|nr:ankyrin repeat-containing domain protein [Dactylonectria estremocensis]
MTSIPTIAALLCMSATQKAWEHIFTKRGTPAILDSFKTLFPYDNLDHWNFSPLHKAVLGVEGFTLSQFVDSSTSVPGVHPDNTDAQQRTALHWAALRGDLSAVELLLNVKADVHVVDEFNCTPLTYAASAAIPRIVELLILSGANVNHVNGRGDSPLHYAARHKDDVESVRILVHAGAEVDRKNPLGNTPFAGAAIANRTAAGKYLLDEGADRYSTNKYGDSPLRETIHHNCHEFLCMLLEDGARYDDTNNHGSSLLHAIALEGDIKTIQIVKAAHLSGLDHQLKNTRGETAMDFCHKRIGAPEGFKEAFSDLVSTLPVTSLS